MVNRNYCINNPQINKLEKLDSYLYNREVSPKQQRRHRGESKSTNCRRSRKSEIPNFKVPKLTEPSNSSKSREKHVLKIVDKTPDEPTLTKYIPAGEDLDIHPDFKSKKSSSVYKKYSSNISNEEGSRKIRNSHDVLAFSIAQKLSSSSNGSSKSLTTIKEDDNLGSNIDVLEMVTDHHSTYKFKHKLEKLSPENSSSSDTNTGDILPKKYRRDIKHGPDMAYFSKHKKDKNPYVPSKYLKGDPHIESEWRGGGRGGESSATRAWRLLRWPIALLLCTVTLAVSIYLLMPESMRQTGNDSSNSTIWGASFGGVGLVNRDRTQEDIKTTSKETVPPGITKSASSSSNDTNKKTATNDAYIVTGDVRQERPTIFKIVTSSIAEKKQKTAGKAPSPVFPTFVAPDVQYGNEKSDDTTIRTPKLQDFLAKQDIVEEESSTLYSTRVEEKPKFAIYYKDIEHIRNGNNQADRIVHDSEAAGALDSRPNIVSVVSDHNVNGARRKLNFTSGHSNMFGLSLEESHRIRSTTDIYSTRVSPTLPSMRDTQLYGITTAKSRLNNTEEESHCQSTHLSLCRGVLPYDLAAPTSARLGDLEAALPLFEYVVQSSCSARARPFLCALLEPECAPPGVTPLMPCRSACRAVTESCEDVIAQLASYEAARAFDCRAFPVAEAEGGGCVAAGVVMGGIDGAACTRGEVACAVDGSCMPAHWLCDGSPDCPGGTDERNCSACKGNEFRCEMDKTCLPSSWVCDGYADCADGADESHCGLDTPGAAASDHRPVQPLSPYRDAAPRNVAPQASKMAPRLGKATHAFHSRVADRAKLSRAESNGDEADGSKELLMMSDTRAPHIRAPPAFRRPLSPSTPAPTTSPSTTTEEEEMEEEAETTMASSGHVSPCPPGELRCVDGRCIMFSQLCDGYTDCSDGADEGNCYLR